ncbi:hypothetical protein BO94DRAFT_512674 [Aspergillus sclerotioniger CBS 115572]|uniref:DUF7102 domain-containing protein n=1 Tax=Aspergillus sclerotioniger CBS 115572 TaxID=1450535 RepID=A0A317WZB9_9EURO|nr:hypothetical protein BO94DRAFT_512674 [Aspergillus sclerotioniger CBS 115572]PWY91724.1 hypothetical protein BO94DRAFT_512674 [Aspergillus sclerotioniger CBS 115572]
MAQTNDPALLHYVRFYGIASDYLDPDPLEYIDKASKIVPDFLRLSTDTVTTIQKQVEHHQQTVEKRLCHEKLDIRKESVRFLSSVLRDTKRNIDDCWDKILPKWDRYDSLKLEAPVFSSGYDTDLRLPDEPLGYSHADYALRPLDELSSDHEINPPGNTIHDTNTIDKKTIHEKLDCTKAALLLIQNARHNGNRPLSEIENLFRTPLDATLEKECHSILSPLLPLDADYYSSKGPSPIPGDKDLPSPIDSNPHDVLTSGDIDILQYKYFFSHEESSSTAYPGPCDCAGKDQVLETDEDQSSLKATAKGSLTYEQTLDNGSFDTDIDLSGGRVSHLHSEQAISAATSPSSELSQITYTEITDNIATSDCFPYETPIVIATPLRPSYSPISSACSSRCDGEDILESQRPVSQTTHQASVYEAHWECPATDDPLSMPTCHSEASYGSEPDIKSDEQYLTRKRKLENGQTDYKQEQNSELEPLASSKTSKKKTSGAIYPTHLGSLSRFMETRGQAISRETTAKSPYFAESMNPKIPAKEHDFAIHTESTYDPPNPGNSHDQSHSTSSDPTTQIPSFPAGNHERPILSLSTSLLKSHVRMVQCIERISPPLSIVYRESDTIDWRRPHGTQTQHPPSSSTEEEADIIIAPNTGIILTNSQATTQLFLPGHKPRTPSNIKNINSPLRERVFLLSGKYEHLYVLITHCSGATITLPSSELTLDKNMLLSLTAFTAFCNSMSYSSIYPLVIPSSPDAIAGWIVALANKSLH